MSRSTACQFRGVRQVIKAYVNNEVAAWALCNGPNMLYKYEGGDMTEGENQLRSFLTMLQEGESQAIYTLRLYEDHKADSKIKSNTPFDLSYNFSLWESDDDAPYNRRRGKVDAELAERLDRLEKLLSEKEEEEEEPEEESKAMKVIAGVMKIPGMQEQIGSLTAGIVKSLLNFLPAMREQGRQVAGIPDMEPEIELQAEEQPPVMEVSDADRENAIAWQSIPIDEQRKILTAIRVLYGRDKKLGDHLGALANLSAVKYNMALTFL